MKKLLKHEPALNRSGKFKTLICLTLLLFLSASPESYSQLVDKHITKVEKEFFFIDPMVFFDRDENKGRLDLYIEIPLENLQFKKNSSTKDYDASISYLIKITNSANEIVSNELISDFISTTKGEQKSLDEASNFIVKDFNLNPGQYSLEVTLTDKNTKTEGTIKEKIEIADFSQKEISFSDVMLVSNIKEENGKKIITPLIDKNIDNLKEVYLFFEVYNSNEQSVINNFSFKVTDVKERVVETGEHNYTFTPGKNKIFEKLVTDNLVFGSYVLEIKDKTNGELVATKEFANKLNGFPLNKKDLNLMIDQLMYITTGEQLSKIKNAPTEELKEKYFIDFWRQNDPSPYTNKNENMVDYYKRIETANERYTHWIDGWKTDMGMVYIIYGEPNNIERYPFTENTKPYEIWQYYSSNKEFIYVDDTGFGDYKLVIPIWDENGTKIRN